MEAVIDALIGTIEEFRSTPSSAGGISDVIEVNTYTKWGNPGLVEINEYPYFYVEPMSDGPNMETMGLAGRDMRTLSIQIGFVVNAADYFDQSIDEVSATRQVVQVGEALWKWLRRFSLRSLDDPVSIRNVTVPSVDYTPRILDGEFIRLASISLNVDKQYAHVV